MVLKNEDKLKLEAYLETTVGRADRLVSELRELLKERAKNKGGKFIPEDFISYLEWIYNKGAEKIRSAPTWDGVGQIMSLIFDVAQDSGLSLIRKNEKVREQIRLKVRVLGISAQNSPYFEKFRYTMSLMGIKISGVNVKRPSQTIKKPRLWGFWGLILFMIRCGISPLRMRYLHSYCREGVCNTAYVLSKDEILAQLL